MRMLVFVMVCGLTCQALAGTGDVERVEKGNLVIEGIPEIPTKVTERQRLYRNTRSAQFQGWLPSGEGILISTRFGETSQIHQVRVPGGAREQVTFFDEPVRGATISPNAGINGFFFARDNGGSEFFQLFFYDLGTRRYRMVSDGKARNGSPAWSPDGKRFTYYSTARNGRDWDIYLGDITSEEAPRPILEKSGAWLAVSWSPDGTNIMVINLISAADIRGFLLNADSGELKPLVDTKETVAFGGASFSHDGKGVYFSSDQGSEFKRLRYLDLASGQMRILTDDIPWDVGNIDVSQDGRWLGFVANEDGISKLYVHDLKNDRYLTLPNLPVGQVGGLRFRPGHDELGFTVNSPRTPGDVYSVDLKTDRLMRWTNSEVGGLNTANFAVPELIHYETFDEVNGDKRTIPAFYYKPKGKGPFPVLISIHGGPEGQARPFFNAGSQYLIGDLGVALITPNVRGSSGYGKTYLSLDNGFKREDSVKDIGKIARLDRIP